MHASRGLSRRGFLALVGAAPFVGRLVAAGKIPVGLELYSVRDLLKADPEGTVRAVAKLGYEVVEFYAPYYDWTPQQAADMRKVLDDSGIRCRSTHNSPVSFTADGIQKAIDLNKTIGSTLLVMASAGRVSTADDWKRVADQLNTATEKLKAAGMVAGYHNHGAEWRAFEDGQRPMDILAKHTDTSVVLQFDVGTCVEEKQDPVAWITANPGRIKSMHCKDFQRDGKRYAALFGEGDAPWAAIFKAAESVGGIETYLIEQEEGPGPASEQLTRARQCLANWKKMRG